MSTQIMGRVWIHYPEDPSSPRGWEIYDAITGTKFTDVTMLQIGVEISSYTVVDLWRINTQGPERYYLVPCPGKQVSIPTETTAGVPRKACAECGGSGYYVSPVTAKRSPCSAGCKHP